MGSSRIIQELRPLFNPRSVAVIGASNNPAKWGYSTCQSVVNSFGGKCYPVNANSTDIFGLQTFKRVTDVPDPVDLAVFVIPPEWIPSVMTDCVDKGVKAAVIITAGFQEIGEKGKKLQDEVLGMARKGGLRFVGPNCMGIWSASCNLNTFMAPMPVTDGPLAFVTQGGNVGASILRSAYGRGVGFREYVSCGAAADIRFEDYIEYFANDPDVRVILAYIEGLDEGRAFIERVGPITKKKPVVVLKSGITEAGGRAARSHSGALAGSKMVYDAAFEACGVIEAQTIGELLDTAVGFLTQPLPRGRDVAILTGGGSYGVMCADACEEKALNVVELPERVINELSEHLPERWSHGNPVDPAGDRDFGYFLQIPDLLLPIENVDSLLFMGAGGFSQLAPVLMASGFTASSIDRMENVDLSDAAQVMDEYLANTILGLINKYRKPVITTTFGEVSSRLVNGVYHYVMPERAAEVMRNLVKYKEYLDKEGVTAKPDYDPFMICKDWVRS